MRAVIQRVKQPARVIANGKMTGQIEKGLVVFLGVEEADNNDDVDWLVNKISNMRIFDDAEGKMNLSVKDIDGGILVISQFTLHANIKKGHRPSFIRAAAPEFARQMYDRFIEAIREKCDLPVASGVFGAYMKVDLVNDGPVTIIADSKMKEL